MYRKWVACTWSLAKLFLNYQLPPQFPSLIALLLYLLPPALPKCHLNACLKSQKIYQMTSLFVISTWKSSPQTACGLLLIIESSIRRQCGLANPDLLKFGDWTSSQEFWPCEQLPAVTWLPNHTSDPPQPW